MIGNGSFFLDPALLEDSLFENEQPSSTGAWSSQKRGDVCEPASDAHSTKELSLLRSSELRFELNESPATKSIVSNLKKGTSAGSEHFEKATPRPK